HAALGAWNQHRRHRAEKLGETRAAHATLGKHRNVGQRGGPRSKQYPGANLDGDANSAQRPVRGGKGKFSKRYRIKRTAWSRYREAGTYLCPRRAWRPGPFATNLRHRRNREDRERDLPQDGAAANELR